jgi:hypothetical protein
VCLGDMGSAEHESTTNGLWACKKALSLLQVSRSMSYYDAWSFFCSVIALFDFFRNSCL